LTQFYQQEAEKQKAAEANAKPPDYAPVAISEASSSEFNSQMAPEDLLRGFRHHQVSQQKERHHGNHGTHGASTRGTSTRGQKKVKGLLTEYASKTGIQYYKDLAGNVRQVSFILYF
jgi:sirohydrochlorin ferrochelatase